MADVQSLCFCDAQRSYVGEALRKEAIDGINHPPKTRCYPTLSYLTLSFVAFIDWFHIWVVFYIMHNVAVLTYIGYPEF